MKYDVDFFIRKFEAIPEDKWCRGSFTIKDTHCAFGHCGMTDYTSYRDVPEAKAFNMLLPKAVSINDGLNLKYVQPTPKQRILAALYDIKKMQYPELSETTVEDIISEKVFS